MRPSVLLLLGIHLAFAGKNSLKYFCTSVSGDNDGFTAVGLLNDIQFIYFDINTMKASPKTDWMRQNEKSDHWKKQTLSLIRQHYSILSNVWTKSTGKHTYQLIYGCEWNDETGQINGIRQTGYDGEDFLFLDFKREKWVSKMHQGFSLQERCNNETIEFQYWKNYLEIDCVESLKEFLQFGKRSLEKTVSPQVSLLQKNASSPVLCHVTDFYPSNISITWMKNRLQHYKDVKVGKLLPNEDGTFQKTVTLKAEPDEWKKNVYSCVVEHKSKTIRKTLTVNEIRTNNKTSAPIGMIVAVVSVVILLLVIAVLGYFVYQKKVKPGFVPANIADSGS